MPHTVPVILGPTASGKSDLALYMAERTNGVIINCDSMQVYDTLHAITARPSSDEMATVPHKLYGYVDMGHPHDVLTWRTHAHAEIYTALQNNQTPYIVGGTGFYVHALINGLSPIPDVPDTIRTKIRTTAQSLTTQQIHTHIKTIDPKIAEKFTDRQRLIRAWEVFDTTQTPLSHWQTLPPTGVPEDLNFTIIALCPPRDWLYERCNQRFDKMMATTAMAEVTTLNHRLKNGTVPPESPITKACGVPELLAHLNGECDQQTAITNAKTATRRYAKRQITWLTNQIQPHLTLTQPLSSADYPQIANQIKSL